MIVESVVLQDMVEGSYESLLQRVDEAVEKSADLFGGAPHLFATHADRVTVYVEDKGFFSCGYDVSKIGVSLVGPVKRVNVPDMNEDMIAKRAVDDFFNSGTFGKALTSLISVTPRVSETDSSIRKRVRDLVGESAWRGYVLGGDVERLKEFLTDKDLFEVSQVVDRRFSSDSNVSVPSLVASLADMSQRLSKMNSYSLEAVNVYQGKTGGLRTEEEDHVLSKFDSVAGSFLEDIDEISDALSSAIRGAKAGNIKEAVAIHDGIAQDFENIHLGHRFVRKMASQLAEV